MTPATAKRGRSGQSARKDRFCCRQSRGEWPARAGALLIGNRSGPAVARRLASARRCVAHRPARPRRGRCRPDCEPLRGETRLNRRRRRPRGVFRSTWRSIRPTRRRSTPCSGRPGSGFVPAGAGRDDALRDPHRLLPKSLPDPFRFFGPVKRGNPIRAMGRSRLVQIAGNVLTRRSACIRYRNCFEVGVADIGIVRLARIWFDGAALWLAF
jgi:hypothetical protein